jgi:pyruvate,water dikinase
MPSAVHWLPLDQFADAGIPKLHNLRLAAKAGFDVPMTFWAWARELENRETQPPLPFPLIVRSGSPTEDQQNTSNAGQFLSLPVVSDAKFAESVARVIEKLPLVGGIRQGVVFVQPLLEGTRAGVTFFDGFYYEEAVASGSNQALTSGSDRGNVTRGHVERGNAHQAWLVRLQRRFGGRVDVEWTEDASGRPTLLQIRPALFPIRRSETLSLANHKEILGDPPSPWMVGLLVEVARPVMGFFEAIDPEVATWDEPYAVELGGRAWMNFSAFFRLMDHWGLPRSLVTEGVGGEPGGPLDRRADLGRIVRNLPTLLRKLLVDATAIAMIPKRFQLLDERLEAASTLPELWTLNADALAFSIRTNFAINSPLAMLARFRKQLGLSGAGRVVTHVMMTRYAELAAEPDLENRLAKLDAWLVDYGHRGPLESDPSRPRFAELRDQLRASLTATPTPGNPPPVSRGSSLLNALTSPLFWLDAIRERFRDALMKRWGVIRRRILEAAAQARDDGLLEHVEDIFHLRGDDLRGAPSLWRDRVRQSQADWELARNLDLPTTASRDVLEAAIQNASAESCSQANTFRGIGLGSRVVSGVAVKADDLASLLAGPALPPGAILVAPALEPSWAVVFPRFAAVVVELGGELSHASILLREAGIPAVVNAQGVYRAIVEGERVVVDPARGEVQVEGRDGEVVAPSAF